METSKYCSIMDTFVDMFNTSHYKVHFSLPFLFLRMNSYVVQFISISQEKDLLNDMISVKTPLAYTTISISFGKLIDFLNSYQNL